MGELPIPRVKQRKVVDWQLWGVETSENCQHDLSLVGSCSKTGKEGREEGRKRERDRKREKEDSGMAG